MGWNAEPARARSWRVGILLAICIIAGGVLATTGNVARAQLSELEITTMKGRIERLERDIDQLRRARPAPGAARQQPPAYAVLDSRLAALERELRALTGRLERLEFEARETQQQLETLKSDVEFRLGRLEGDAPPPPGVATAPPPPDATAASAIDDAGPTSANEGGGPRMLGEIPATDDASQAPEAASAPDAGAAPVEGTQAAAALPAGSPREQYAYAFDLLRKAQYAEAEQAFAAFIAAHPENALTDNARYWRAETFYVRGDHAAAAQAFLATYEANKTGQKAPDSLLKLGMALTSLGKTSEACATFAELSRAFPQAAPAIRDKMAEERRRAGCR